MPEDKGQGTKKEAEKKDKGTASEESKDGDKELGGKMTFVEHLEELRRRILVALLTFGFCFIVIYATSVQTLRHWFTKPLLDVLSELETSLIYTGMAEAFIFDLKLAAIASIFISSPMIFYQIWAFVAPGLYKNERFYVGPFIISATLFFVGGAAFFYFIVFPIVADFFSQFVVKEEVEWMPKLSEVFSFVMMMMLAFGSVFELPVVTFILARLRIINTKFLNKNRKYALLIMVVLAAFFTPPDFVSQMLLFGPMWLLFEFSVLITWIVQPKQKPAEEEG